MDKHEHAKKMEQVRNNMNRISAIDQAAKGLDTVGSNEPLSTERVRRAFANGGALTSAEVLRACRADGYNGPDSRILNALRRLTDETGDLTLKGRKYMMRSEH